MVPGFHGADLIVISIPLLLGVFWLWMIVDCINNRQLDQNQKLLWLLVVIFTYALGAGLYFFFGRSGTGNSSGRI